MEEEDKENGVFVKVFVKVKAPKQRTMNTRGGTNQRR